MSLNVATVIEENARRIPDTTAIICDDKRFSYSQLDAATNRVANALAALGVKRDQMVTVMLPNIPEFVIAYFGILKLGAVCVPINTLYKNREIEFLLEDSESVAFICCQGFMGEAIDAFQRAPVCKNLVVVPFPKQVELPNVEGIHCFNQLTAAASDKFETVMTDADETAVLVYTSGTTGKPKGAMITHFNLFYQAFVLPKIHWDEPQPDEVDLALLPLFHCFGQSCVMNARLARGSTISLVPQYDPLRVMEIMQRDKITHFAGVPTMYLQILNHPERTKFDLSHLRECVSGGAPMPVDIIQRWNEVFGMEIREGYGLTETSPVATFNFPGIKPVHGSCGNRIWGCDIKIVDPEGNTLPTGQDGEVAIRGVNIMKGYYKNPEATAAVMKNGWFLSGDQGHLDDRGYLYIVGRIKDMILRGGFNIYPRELEELLFEHPAVHECAVIGIPDPEMGEEVKAVVYLKPGQSVTADELKAFCKDRIAAYKYPRIVEIRPEPLPKGPTGKILKRELQQQHIDATKK